MSAEQFWEACQLNRDVQLELTAEGELIIMPPTGARTGTRNARLIQQLTQWADEDGSGVAFDSSTGFELPNGAIRSPDVAWVRRNRLTGLPPERLERFLPLCPDFVIELRSPTDPLVAVQDKLREYITNGAQLGWLVEPALRRVHVYRPGAVVESLDNPATLSGDPVLPRFVLDLTRIWDPGL
ncbi:Uma2 family endonuclease [Candidatus Binatia bacterium]|nr:Uma2 family endonuclease [Candidatus Binatia bacterium]